MAAEFGTDWGGGEVTGSIGKIRIGGPLYFEDISGKMSVTSHADMVFHISPDVKKLSEGEIVQVTFESGEVCHGVADEFGRVVLTKVKRY